jgi:SAM-dependent methyltransferase
LRDEYFRQQLWRDWDRYLDRLPLSPGQHVWDIGCGVGEVSARLRARVAHVTAVDADPQMLETVRRRKLEGVALDLVDLRTGLPTGRHGVDGIWCGFSLAYLVDAEQAIRRWTSGLTRLNAGAWVAVLEIDRLFTGHGPLPDDILHTLDDFEERMRRDKLYDFRMGSRVAGILERLGFEIILTEQPEDPELNFNGPAHPDIIEAWSARLGRMHGMRTRLGGEFESIREAFLACLSSDRHTCDNTLLLVVAKWPDR